jgi:glycosyltransferase involved in cell wall biosynthesis
MKKIAVFAGSDLRNYGGGEKDIIGWTSRLSDRLDLTVYSLIEPGSHRVTKRFIQESMPGMKIVWYHGLRLRMLKDVLPFRFFNVEKYDKVYSMSQGFILNNFFISSARRFLLGIHVQSTLDSEPIESDKLWKRIAFIPYRLVSLHFILNADEIRVQNRDDLKALNDLNYKGRIWIVPPRTLKMAPEPVDTGDFRVVWVNRIAPEKRPEELVKIAQLCPNVEFRVIGSGDASAFVDAPHNIILRGFLSDEELSDELRKASAYVSTSRGENFGMSCVEAQMHGLPTIAYDVRGLRDYALYIVDDAYGAAELIHELRGSWLLHKDEYMTRRASLQKEAISRFGDDAVLPQIEKMLEGE